MVELARYVSNYYENILFGGTAKFHKLPPEAALFIADLKRKHHNIDNVCRTYFELEKDLDSLLRAVENGNNYFLNYGGDAPPPKFRTQTVQNFYFQLSKTCRGQLTEGAFSNRFVYDTLYAAFFNTRDRNKIPVLEQFVAPPMTNAKHQNEALLRDMTLGRKLAVATFDDANFWANAAKNVIEKKQNFIHTPAPEKLRGIKKMFYLKCQSLGRIVDPYSMRINLNEELDPAHYISHETLFTFIKQNPNHPLARSVSDLCRVIFHSIFDGKGLDFCAILDTTTNKFLNNINIIDKVIPTIDSPLKPPLLLDVFHRLLALAKYDNLWSNDNVEEKKLPENDDYFRLYLQNVALERENVTLRNHSIGMLAVRLDQLLINKNIISFCD